MSFNPAEYAAPVGPIDVQLSVFLPILSRGKV